MPVNNIRAALCVLLVLALATTVPVAAADDDPATGPVEGKCVKISPFDVPPVSVYDCPDVPDP